MRCCVRKSVDTSRKEGDTAPVSDASDAVTTYVYDPHGNHASMTEPNGNTATYEYDALHRRSQDTNAAGEVTRYTYDLPDLPDLPGCSDCTGPMPGSSLVTGQTNPNGNVIAYGYDAKDHLRQVQDAVGLVARYTYDREHNRLSETDGNSHTTSYLYDAIYRMAHSVDPLGVATL